MLNIGEVPGTNEMRDHSESPGDRLVRAVRTEKPLQIVGSTNALYAILAKRAGFSAIYLSGGGVAAGSLGVPDLGIVGLEDRTATEYLTCNDARGSSSSCQA